MALAPIANENGAMSPSQGGGSGSSTPRRENLSSQLDGVKTVFTTSAEFKPESLLIQINQMTGVEGLEYTIGGDNHSFTLLINPPLPNGEYLFVRYQEA